MLEVLDVAALGEVIPEYQIVFPQTQAVIKCLGEKNKVKWMKDGVELPDIEQSWGDQELITLTLPSVTPEVEGKYGCVGFGIHPFTTIAEVYSAGISHRN